MRTNDRSGPTSYRKGQTGRVVEQPQRVIIKPEDIQRFAQMIAANPQAAINFQKMPPS